VKEEVKISKTFCGTHFFNPARYLKLFEIIPGPQTSSEVWTSLLYMERNF
jgi:3-hydroxyacyl-CoA dehydrogenase